MVKNWTQEEIEYLKSNYADTPTKELEDIFNRGVDSIQLKASKLGLKRNIFRWNTELFQKFLNENFNNEFLVLSDFIATGKEITVQHLICNNVWVTKPSNFIYGGNSCRFCSSTRIIEKTEFEKRVRKINPHIVFVDEYKTIKVKMKVSCSICEYEWMARPEALLEINKYCPKCNNRKFRETKEFIEDIFLVNPNVTLLEEPTKASSKILIKCNIDEYKWYATPTSLIRGVGCPKCKNVAKPSTDEFIHKMLEINPEIEILGEYTNHYGKIEVKCLNDGNMWLASPHTLLNNIGCPVCSSSKGEKFSVKFFIKHDVLFSSQYSFKDLISDYGNPLRFDFCIYYNNKMFCLVEIDGIGHIKPVKFKGMSAKQAQEKLELIQYHDTLKNEYCLEKNIKLVRIKYNGKNIREINDILNIELSPIL